MSGEGSDALSRLYSSDLAASSEAEPRVSCHQACKSRQSRPLPWLMGRSYVSTLLGSDRISIVLSRTSRKRRSGFSGEAKMRVFGAWLRADPVAARVKTG